MGKSNSFETVQRMVRDHLKDADRNMGLDAGNPGPTQGECYAAAFATATGAYTGGGITMRQWSDLHNDIRGHRDSAR